MSARPFVRVLGISGSLRAGSFNTALLKASVPLMPVQSSLTLFDISRIPLFNQDTERPFGHPEANPEVGKLKAALKEADAVLISTPEYNYGIPGVLKNVIDQGSRPYGENSWSGKPVGLLAASVGAFGASRAQVAWRPIFGYLNMPVVPGFEISVATAQNRFAKDGTLTDKDTAKFLKQYLQNLVDFTLQYNAGLKAFPPSKL